MTTRTAQWYARAISLLQSDRDWKAICSTIAGSHPSVFVRAAETMGWEGRARALLAAGEKVAAVKLCREATGKGLKEALDMVNAWQ